MSRNPLEQLADYGQSVWIDDLSRGLVSSGQLARYVRDDAVVGVTSNPSIFEAALASGNDYDEQLRADTASTRDPKALFERLAVRDVAAACDVLRPVYDATMARPDRHRDGFVSIEVDPTLAYDAARTTRAALRLHSLIDKPNLLVKIPATEEGLAAIEETIAAGKSVNVTLIFSLQRYAQVAEAYLRGLERLVAAGGDPANVASVASFFVSRVDTETDKRLDAIGGHDGLKGKLAIANARLAYARYRELFDGERWAALAAKGAESQRCLWASTSTKNPAYSDVLYVEELIGPATINTLPVKTLHAFAHHGRVARTLDVGVDEARRLLEQLAHAGVDYDDVTATLERNGVQAFAKSFDGLLQRIRAFVDNDSGVRGTAAAAGGLRRGMSS
jgi:transaldolase